MEALSVPELNRQIITRYFQEFWTNGNSDIVDELCDDNVTIFYPMHGRMVGKAAAKGVIARFKQVGLRYNS
jgi:ketosteroid isomerase-like protein